jgi:hypothetical protein
VVRRIRGNGLQQLQQLVQRVGVFRSLGDGRLRSRARIVHGVVDKLQGTQPNLQYITKVILACSASCANEFIVPHL